MTSRIYMKAAILKESKKPLIVEEIERVGDLSFGQVFVKIFYSSICGAQINEIDAVKGEDKFLPHLLGHEASGEVLEIGEGVTSVSVGDKVVLHWRPGEGIQSQTPKYKLGSTIINAGWVTTFNESAVVSENRITKIDPTFSMKQAPLFGCAITTAFGVINNDAKLKIGDSIVIFGLGGVGLNLVQAASMVSANPIIGVDINKNKIDMAKKYGLNHGFLANDKNLNQKIQEVLGGNLPDCVIETTGIKEVIENAYDLTHKDGRTILVGVPKDKVSIYTLPLHFNKILTGSEGGQCKPQIDIPKYIDLINKDKMTLDGIITHEFHLDDINDALDLFRSGSAGRILINMNE